MPSLPADIGTAAASGVETALAFALEAARLARQRGVSPSLDLGALFTASLAALIRGALRSEGGDPAFQALVLRSRDAEVDEHVRQAAQADADTRAVRAAVDAIAHPGKLRLRVVGPVREALAHLHRLAMAGSWLALRQTIAELLARTGREDEPLHAALASLHANPGLERLQRGSALLASASVQQYRALCGQRGPLAGSPAAAAQGRASAQLGAVAEATTAQALRDIVELLNRRYPQPDCYRVVRGLRTPGRFPGATDKAKEEWDAAIVRGAGAADAVAIALLAEVKASPAAATSDFPRLVRGLERLSQARADADYTFACSSGIVRILGRSLRRLHPHGQGLPRHVIYCCAAPPETPVPMLSAASRALLLAEPASLAFARGHGELAAVWEAVTTLPRWRAVLQQYETARRAREAMLHPDDLRSAMAASS